MASTTQRTKSGRTRSSGAQRSSTTATQAKSASTTASKPSTAPAKKDARGTTVHLPFVTAEFHRPDMQLPEMHMPDIRGNVSGMVDTVRTNLPSREEMAYYGGLGLLAALSVIEWPVAAAIGVGTVVAQRAAGMSSQQRQRRSSS